MSRRILLADDGPAIRQVVHLTFLDRDYEIDSVTNGDEALGLLHQRQFDLVLADVHMPGASGYEVCRQAKVQNGDLPVLLLVGNLESYSEDAARSCGADGMLRKPFDSKELLSRVDGLLEQFPGPDDEEAEAVDEPVPAEDDPGTTNGSSVLGDDDVERIARRVVEILGEKTVRDVAWEVVPDVAELIVRDRLRELEAEAESL